ELKNITEYGSSIGLDVDIGAMVLLSHGAPDDLRSFPTRRSSDLAKRLTDGASVAIKLLRTALAQDPRATDRLRREAQALGLSWHPHVVEVLDDGMLSSGVAFLVTELLKGETLGQRIARQGALPQEEVARWGVQAADALCAIHSAGVIHRDVKPNNLFVHRSSTTGERLKLIDFGVAAVSWA